MNQKPYSTPTSLFRVILTLTLIAVTWLATTPVEMPASQTMSDKANHLTAFAVLAFLADFSFPASRFNLKKFLPLLLYGILIEIIQYFLPTRSCSLPDILADTLGLLLYMSLSPLFSRMPCLSHLKADTQRDKKH